jgi:FtsH-binding integral membrane protein
VPTVADVDTEARAPWRHEVRSVLIVAVLVVAAVLATAAVAIFVPPIHDLFSRLPIAIVVLIAGTAWVLWRITRRPASE